MAKTKIIAPWIVAYQQGEHRILRDGCVVIDNDRIVYVGKRYDAPVDNTLQADDSVITPGFINVHVHCASSPLDKSLVEDVGSRQFSLSALPDMLPARGAATDQAGRHAAIDFSMAEFIRTGTTTVMEIGSDGAYTADAAERAGLRAYIADGYRSGKWYTTNGRTVEYAWDEDAGMGAFKDAITLIEKLEGRAQDRIRGYLSPMQVDTCSEALLRRSKDAAEDMHVPLALHVSQSVFEFDEMVKRHGLTPIEWLDSIGFLGERNILGHAIMPAGHSWVQFAGDDLQLLADAGASVAHCSWVFNRRGLAMESYPEYQARGINLCLGTDTAPQSMLEALKWSAVVGKMMKRQTEVATAADVFNAATLNAARMLQRDDLGRIAAGAKADLLFWDAKGMSMVPLRDPIRNIVYNAQAYDLREVMVDGQWLMRARRLTTLDESAICEALQHAAEQMWPRLKEGHWSGKDVDSLSPPSFKAFTDDAADKA